MTSPASSPEGARLAAALRQSRERTGLSLAGLAAATAFSKSSWERYLNGKALPPRGAVQELCRLAGEPDGRCLALWEIAESQWGGRTREAPPAPRPTVKAAADQAPRPASGRAPGRAALGPDLAPAPGPAADPDPDAAADAAPDAAPGPASDPADSPPAAHRGNAAVAVLASVCALVLGAVALTLLLLPGRTGTSGAADRPASPPAAGPLCRDAACEGRDPMSMKCAATPDTLTEHRTTTGASVQLRYSRICGTSWARMWGARVGDRIELRLGRAGDRDRTARVRDRADADAYVYTPMSVTRPGVAVQACFLPGAGGGEECFTADADPDPGPSGS